MERTPLSKQAITRRTLLGGVAGLAATTLLAACGADPTATARPAVATGTAVSGAGTAISVPTAAATAAATTAASAAPATTPTGVIATAVTSASPAASATSSTPVKPTAVPVPTGATGLPEGTAAAQAVGVQPPPNLVGKLSLKKINVAFVPSEDAGKTLSDNKDLLAHMKQAFGVDVSGAVGTSYTAVIEAMRSKKVDIAFYGPFSYILANAETGAQALIQGQDKDGKLATYTSIIMIPADSPMTTLADIKGKNFSFVDVASTSGHLVPNFTILSKTGLKSNVDYRSIFAGSHPGSYQAVLNKKVDAGAIASDIFATGVAAGTIDATKVKILDTSFPIPGSPIAVRGDIAAADQELFLQFFLSINDQPKDSAVFKAAVAGLGTGTVKMLKADDSTYNELRKIPAAIGIDIKGLK